MRRKPLLTSQQAKEQYQALLDEYKSQSAISDKGRTLRTRLDVILQLAASRNQNIFDNLNEVFDGHATETEVSLLNRLTNVRLKLNNLVHGNRFITEAQYRQYLSVVCEFVCYISSTPMPPQLILATLSLVPRDIPENRGLDVVVLLQLYSSMEQVGDGANILKEFHKMFEQKDFLRLNTVRFHLFTYGCPLFQLSDISHSTDLRQKGKYTPSIDDVALNRALGHIAQLPPPASEKDRPWLMWLCQDISPDLPAVMVQRLAEMKEQKQLAFLPIPLNRGAHGQFLQLWPDCKPTPLSPGLAGNFFLSVLNTIQKKLISP